MLIVGALIFSPHERSENEREEYNTEIDKERRITCTILLK